MLNQVRNYISYVLISVMEKYSEKLIEVPPPISQMQLVNPRGQDPAGEQRAGNEFQKLKLRV